jgi:hypothetical protein
VRCGFAVNTDRAGRCPTRLGLHHPLKTPSTVDAYMLLMTRSRPRGCTNAAESPGLR